ncbi:TetR/AcrR family transcriptional regulator [Thalassolituus sp. LLYu03]|uniref:TetR/AcrR family transcriptional regulator n=1 Tax=Thalassolituus sp. LLYu03 TaxID=3421656 RepID=UPI003D2E2F61
MARRQDHSPQELQALVVQHVLSCLQSQPVNTLSLRQIARDVGYSPGTLINQFGSYNLLLLAVNAATLDRLYQTLHDAMSKAPDHRGALSAAALRYLQFARDQPHAWRLVFELRLTDEEPLPAWQDLRIGALFALLENRLAGLKSGARTDDCREAARVLWAGVQGICQLTLDNKLFIHDNSNGELLIASLMNHYLTSWVSS